eukprot:3026182-Ditylum_brightwellii.AAC.1
MPLYIPLLLAPILLTIGMLYTAHSFEHNPECCYVNCCRVVLYTWKVVYGVLYNLYHCQLSDILVVVCAREYYDDDDNEMTIYAEEELERMKLRPGIERALDVEHRKSLKKVVNMEMKRGGAGSSYKKKVTKKQNSQQLPRLVMQWMENNEWWI